ncbi:hypothetical protein CHS0354_035050 [Potamilus streckersoni]|uniref:Uncharacterized protein n=1 Tax=Potamilus streckersoni TaxID=2493646 RepID=A0AAE0SAC0_9BIVA|nr:hypothetical protein CHS0354_035050 [Potamilus streckersoni]
MTKITVAFSVIVSALLLTLTLGSLLERDANFDLSGQNIDQEAKLLAQLQDARKRSRTLTDERQQPYSALGEIVQKEPLSEDEALNRDLVLSKPNRRRKCVAFCWLWVG